MRLAAHILAPVIFPAAVLLGVAAVSLALSIAAIIVTFIGLIVLTSGAWGMLSFASSNHDRALSSSGGRRPDDAK